MARYGYGMSVSGSRKSIVASGGAAPSGIEVATTASVTVAGFTGGNTTYNGTYTKGTSGGVDPTITTPPTDGEVYIKGINAIVLLPPSVTIGGNNSYDGDQYPYSFTAQGNWTISAMNDDGEGATSLLVIATNASSNNNYIPTTGWSPSITITAAPSNIPLSQTNISLTGFSFTSSSNTDFPFNLTSSSITIPKYAESNNTTWYSPDNSSGYAVVVEFNAGVWAIRILFSDPDVNENVATNPAPNTSIPVTGWVFSAGAGNSGSVTITAA